MQPLCYGCSNVVVLIDFLPAQIQSQVLDFMLPTHVQSICNVASFNSIIDSPNIIPEIDMVKILRQRFNINETGQVSLADSGVDLGDAHPIALRAEKNL